MRLLNTSISESKLKLEEFGDNNAPLYAILSHVWQEKEVTFQDIHSAVVGELVGYEKVREACSIAAADGFHYIWIDTCCIDKTSSAELSEAINSMYRWYHESGVCYAYLADVLSNAVDQELAKSRWFTRGWTLQELIAPSTVIFVDQKWQKMGTKSSRQHIISQITGIPANVLLGDDLERLSVAQKMSWASKRETTRVEDIAYSLMGIFGINMPLLYGEGERAFIRLQEEIMKVSDDHSLFAWESSKYNSGLLATSPAAFVKSGQIIPIDSSDLLSESITVSKKGIRLKLRIVDRDRPGLVLAILPCIMEGKIVAIYMRTISLTNEYFVREQSKNLELLEPKHLSQSKHREESICVRQEHLAHKSQTPLTRAAEKGHEVVVMMLLQMGTDLESRDKFGRTPLSQAAGNGHEIVVKLLLENGAKLESRDIFDQTPLSHASEKGHEMVVKLLFENGADPESCDIFDQTPLSHALEKGHEIVVKLLLEKGAKLESKDQRKAQPLHLHTSEKAYKMILGLLLEKDAVLEPKHKVYGQILLFWAAEEGYERVVKLLLEKGTELETKDRNSQTPLSWAAGKGHEKVARLLLERGAELETVDKNGKTPLLYAAERGHEVVVKLLGEKGASLEIKDGNGRTPLSYAAGNGHEAVVKLLLDKDVLLEAKDNNGQTPLSWAARTGYEAILELLLERGASLLTEARGYRSPLSYAAEEGHEAMVKLLLEKEAGLETEMPLAYAVGRGHEAVVKLLLERGSKNRQ